MVENRESRKREEELRFWEAFMACAEENRVTPDRSGYYVRWAKDFVNLPPGKRLRDRSGMDIESFLAFLRKGKGINDWQVRQADHAPKILYEVFLPRYSPARCTCPEPPRKRSATKPIVKAEAFRDQVTAGEVEVLLSGMDGLPGLMTGLMYGSGLRLMECVRLRVKGIDFSKRQILVRDGKGQKDRITMLPDRFADAFIGRKQGGPAKLKVRLRLGSVYWRLKLRNDMSADRDEEW